MFYPLISESSSQVLLRSLKHVVLGAELINGKDLKDLHNRLPNIQFYNTYGPAEATDICTSYRITADDIQYHKSIPIGKPINNSNLMVLDHYQQPVPVGLSGELYISLP
jgi:non-ribosomal peptide synthetase component F